MKRQKSFTEEKPTLYLVPTPIGNLSEMSPRAIETLQSVDVIACEDTRTSGQLLKHFDIRKRLIAYQNFNEEKSSLGIVKLLEEGNNVALISDAGYPCINDPGQTVVSRVIEEGYHVVSISGPSAFLNALVASGLIVMPFCYIGFVSSNASERRKKFNIYKDLSMTSIYYEAPHRIERFLKDMLEIFGDRNICLARELTKLHEEYLRGKISEILEVIDTIKGEMVVIVEAKKEERVVDLSNIMGMVNQYIDQGMSKSDAIKAIAKETGYNKNEIYSVVHRKS